MKTITKTGNEAHNLKELDIDFECAYDTTTLEDSGEWLPSAYVTEGNPSVLLDTGNDVYESSRLFAPYEVVNNYDIVNYARQRRWTAFCITEVTELDEDMDYDDDTFGWAIVGKRAAR